MKTIEDYTPPSADALASLKHTLGYTSQQMADITGLAQGGQWRKYTGGATPRSMGMHMHFYMAALLTLPEAEVTRIVELMREQGADVATGEVPDYRGPAGVATVDVSDPRDFYYQFIKK